MHTRDSTEVQGHWPMIDRLASSLQACVGKHPSEGRVNPPPQRRPYCHVVDTRLLGLV